MIDILRDTHERLLRSVPTVSHRFLFENFDLEPRLTGLVGPRGVGKTTVLLQLIKEKLSKTADAFYISADHIYFSRIGLFDFVRNVYEMDGTTRFFVDEVHKYAGWAQEIKNIYDSFPDIRMVFSGSSSLNLVKGSYDLSRRAVLRHLPGLSFREYLNFGLNTHFEAVSYEDILKGDEPFREIIAIKGLLGYFRDYLERGYYPFAFEDPAYYFDKISVVVDKTIYEDIANFFSLKTENLRIFKKLLTYLATIPPGALNTHSLAKNLLVDDKTAGRYLSILIDTGLARVLPADKRGSSQLRKAKKLFLDNPSLHYAMAHELNQQPDVGTLRELFFLNAAANAGLGIFYSDGIGDVRIGRHTFEIGGTGKGAGQLRGAKGDAFVVKDGILSGLGRTIPLYRFGFLY